MNFIRSTFSPVAQMVAATAIFALVLSLTYGAPFVSATVVGDADQDALDGKVFMCHAKNTSYDEGKKEVSISSIVGGHDGHTNAGADDRGDIIPNFNYLDNKGDPQYFPGLNWDTAGKAIWNNGCEAVPPPVLGCADADATNYNEDATEDDGSCLFPLTVNKVIVGTTDATADDFSFQVDGGSATAFEIDGSNVLSMANGTYDITEVAASGFTTTYEGCTDVVVDGTGATCTITNTVVVITPCPEGYTGTYPNCIPPNTPTGTIKVWKQVVGGTEPIDYSDFSFTVDGGSTTTFPANQNYVIVSGLTLGTHTIAEVTVPGYTTAHDEVTAYGSNTVIDSNCVIDVVADPGTKFCRITNTVIPPIEGCMDADANNYVPEAEVPTACTYDLTVTKVVVNSSTDESNFSFAVDGGIATAFEADGTNVVSVSAGTHSVAETTTGNYVTTYSNTCTNMLVDGPVTCTITNTFDRGNEEEPTGSITLDKVVTGKDADTSKKFSFGSFLPTTINLAANDAPVVIDGLDADSYIFNENNLSGTGWTLTSVQCVDTDTDAITNITIGENDTVTITLAEDQDLLCTFTNTFDNGEQPTYLIDGFKWNDLNGNRGWLEIVNNEKVVEPKLTGWVIEVTNGDVTYSTTTDADGYYWFEVPAGEWTVSEVQQAGWTQTYPAPVGDATEGVCTETLGETLLSSVAMGDSVSPVATHLECNFGNHQDDEDERELTCEISASASEVDENDDVTIFWNSTLADTATLNGSAVALNGSQVFEDMEEDTTFTLVATQDVVEGEDNVVECSVTVEVDEDNGGSSSSGSRKKRSSTTDDDPIGEVLGETTSVLPVGAPDTGAGGAAQSPLASLVALFGMLMSLVTLRVTKNVQ